eukprot:CAMPEP_0204554682 /NCGR_PEP_ID=MMETSP0661-20131031/28289_1 /ASSEMBLY_ACC=CAM_ASM_000606 /TAXON_ID=109239 /ORGANISM="Alexandrium margalefi, Strain AMGDE01CS-322" /LENGTH=57 /DNA_ID=CAMNT_0051561759 /DNA_START=110 /DNA_END=283 /DNA_ORIENTATION=-
MATFSDFGVLVIGIVGYRGLQLCTLDIITGARRKPFAVAGKKEVIGKDIVVMLAGAA